MSTIQPTTIMKIQSLLSLASVFIGVAILPAQIVNFEGTVAAANITNIPWVQGANMWGTVEASSNHATSASGFASLATVDDITDFTWTFGDLELGVFQSPGLNTAGFEIYNDTDSSGTSLTFSYGSELWATGEILYLQVDVANSQTFSATGIGQAQIMSDAGSNSIFYSEIMALTGNTGLLDFTINGFFAVDVNGNFTSNGSFSPVAGSAVPEPETYALLLGLGGLGIAFWKRRRTLQTAKA